MGGERESVRDYLASARGRGLEMKALEFGGKELQGSSEGQHEVRMNAISARFSDQFHEAFAERAKPRPRQAVPLVFTRKARRRDYTPHS